MQTTMLPALPMHYETSDVFEGLLEGASISFVDLSARYGTAIVTDDDAIRPGGTIVQRFSPDYDTEDGPTVPRRWIPKKSQTLRRVEEPRTTIELWGRDAESFAWAEGSVDVELDLDGALDALFEEAAIDLGDEELEELVNDTTVELFR